MRERSLIDRLRHRDPAAGRTTQVDLGQLADSVMLNLRQMLNSRQGLARTVDDYGLPDLTDVVHNFPEAIDVCRRIGDRHLEAAVENHLADLLHTASRDDEALIHLRRAVEAFAEVGGDPADPDPGIWMLTAS